MIGINELLYPYAVTPDLFLFGLICHMRSFKQDWKSWSCRTYKTGKTHKLCIWCEYKSIQINLCKHLWLSQSSFFQWVPILWGLSFKVILPAARRCQNWRYNVPNISFDVLKFNLEASLKYLEITDINPWYLTLYRLTDRQILQLLYKI